MSFPCTSCGICCRSVGLWLSNKDQVDIPHIKFAMEIFPYNTDELGVCENFIQDGETTGCSVYENRPLLCDSDKLAWYMDIPPEVLYKLNAFSCNQMQEEAGLPVEYRIDENQWDQ